MGQRGGPKEERTVLRGSEFGPQYTAQGVRKMKEQKRGKGAKDKRANMPYTGSSLMPPCTPAM